MSSQDSLRKSDPSTPARRICVVGLGYVGHTVAAAFDDVGHDVSGYDIDDARIDRLRDGAGEGSITYASDPGVIGSAEFVVIAVPTPITEAREPNLAYLEDAAETVGEVMAEDAIVVLESTVFPGATRHVLTPALAAASGKTPGEDFTVGYSPERIVPGPNGRGVDEAVKVVSAFDDDTREQMVQLYRDLTTAGVCEAPTVEVAEAAKCIENIQRDVNIALTNELAIACDSMGIDWRDVLSVAATKWNFHDAYRPGLVGGHCIPVDPYFFLAESASNGFEPELIATARSVNDAVPGHVGRTLIKALNDARKVLSESRVLILGLTYKPNVSDIRSSAIDGVIERLREFDVAVAGHDPLASDEAIRRAFDIEVRSELSFAGFDAVVLGAFHDAYATIDFAAAGAEMAPRPILFDVEDALPEELPPVFRVVRI